MQVASLVVDVTYRCNARCAYCQWGDGKSAERRHVTVDALQAPPSLLRRTGIGRIVFSGGEPLLHPRLTEVIRYYRDAGSQSRVVITNGLLADARRLSALHAAGATGYAFSIDAIDTDIAHAVRGMDEGSLKVVLENLAAAGEFARSMDLELTVNCVLSAPNCDVEVVRSLVAHVHQAGATSVKFQPVFDDGYLGTNAPQLRLTPGHAEVVRTIGQDARSWPIPTNVTEFFEDLAALCEGSQLPGERCGLAGRSYVLQGGRFVICPWIGGPIIGAETDLEHVVGRFPSVAASCRTGSHCFCLQPPDHRWGMSVAVR